MRPMLSAVVVAAVLLIAAFLFVVPTAHPGLSAPAHAASGLRTAVAPTYSVALALATNPVLPGYHDSLFYEVENNTNHAPIQTLSTITILGTYYNTGLKLLKLPGTPINVSTAPIGSWSFLVPVNATANPADIPVITVWANSTSLHMNQSQSTGVNVGTLAFTPGYPRVCAVLGACGALIVGDPATVSTIAWISADYGFITGPASNETVKVLFYSTGSSPVTVPGVPASIKTDAMGNAALGFTPNSTVFNVPGPNHVEVEVTDAVNASYSIYTNVSWNLYNPAGTTDFAFWLNSAQYYSGGTVTANWQWRGTNATVGTLNVTNYVAFDATTGDLIANGLIGSTATTGSFSFVLASTYYGDFDVEMFAHNSSDWWILGAAATASQAIFGISPSEYYYNPGDTITVVVTSEGPALSGATTSALVKAGDSGQTLFNGPVTGGQFQFQIPMVAPASSYSVAAWATNAAGNVIASASGTLDEGYGYALWVGVSTVSPYSDGSFTPGSTVQLSYKITAYGTSPLPTVVEIEVCTVYCAAGTPAIKTWAESGASGSVPFTIPSGLPDGPQTFIIGAFFGTGAAEGLFTVVVNSTPSPLNYELVGGSGLTVGWLILLILIVVVALLIVAMLRRRGKPSTMVMSPAAATTPAPEWKEAQQGGSTGGTTGGATGGSSDTSAPPGAQ